MRQSPSLPLPRPAPAPRADPPSRPLASSAQAGTDLLADAPTDATPTTDAEPLQDDTASVASLPSPVPSLKIEDLLDPASTPPASGDTDTAADTSTEVPTETPEPAPPPPPPPPAFTAIGDSVMLGAAGALQSIIGGIGIDAEVSRHVDPAIAIITDYLQRGLLGQTVILHIGNNGPMYDEQFDAIMELLPDRTVVFVNLRVPRDWQDWNNDIIAAGVAQHQNAFLIDWHAASDGKPTIFWDDGYHLRPEGADLYANLIASNLPG